MKRIAIYTRSWCPYSVRAKALLEARNLEFTDIDVTADAEREAEMITRAGRSSVPQVFIDGEHVGGYDELARLDARVGLDRIIAAGSEAAVNGG